MPAHLVGASVVCYAAGPDHLDALKRSVAKLRAEGYIFEDVHGQIHELDPLKWREHVESTWGEFRDHLPTQDEVVQKVAAGQIFYGPFCGYETK